MHNHCAYVKRENIDFSQAELLRTEYACAGDSVSWFTRVHGHCGAMSYVMVLLTRCTSVIPTRTVACIAYMYVPHRGPKKRQLSAEVE